MRRQLHAAHSLRSNRLAATPDPLVLIVDVVKRHNVDHGGSGASASGAILINGWRVRQNMGGSGRMETKFSHQTWCVEVSPFEASKLRKVTTKATLTAAEKHQLLLFLGIGGTFTRTRSFAPFKVITRPLGWGIHESFDYVLGHRYRSNGIRIVRKSECADIVKGKNSEIVHYREGDRVTSRANR